MKDRKARHRLLFPTLGNTDNLGWIIHRCRGEHFKSFFFFFLEICTREFILFIFKIFS